MEHRVHSGFTAPSALKSTRIVVSRSVLGSGRIHRVKKSAGILDYVPCPEFVGRLRVPDRYGNTNGRSTTCKAELLVYESIVGVSCHLLNSVARLLAKLTAQNDRGLLSLLEATSS